MDDLNSVPPGSDCERCGHPFDDHLLWAEKDNVMGGGVMTCPLCDCTGTWSVAARG
jgi:hypothetical protein